MRQVCAAQKVACGNRRFFRLLSAGETLPVYRCYFIFLFVLFENVGELASVRERAWSARKKNKKRKTEGL